MAKNWFHVCAMADIHINDVDDFYYDVCMAQSDLKIRSPDIDVDASGITPEILRGCFFKENPDYSRVYLDFDIRCESEAEFRRILNYIQNRTNTFSSIQIQYEPLNTI